MIPSKESKETLWNWYLDETAADSHKSFEASMFGFWNWTHFSVVEPYVEKFFHAVVNVFKKRPSNYSKMFFKYLAPGIASEKILKAYEDLAGKLEPEQKILKAKVEAAITDQKRMLKAYELCRKYYEAAK